MADYGGVQLTLGPHPLTYLRELLDEEGGHPRRPASTRSRTAPRSAPPAR